MSWFYLALKNENDKFYRVYAADLLDKGYDIADFYE